MSRERTDWSDVRLVAGREVGEKLRSKAFLLSTLFFLAIVSASIALPALLFDDSPPTFSVAALGPQAAALVESAPSAEVELEVVPAADVPESESLLRTEQIDAAIEVRGDALVVSALREVPPQLVEVLRSAAQVAGLQAELERRGASPEQVLDVLTPVEVEERLLDDRGRDPDVVPVLTIAFALLFFFVVYQFGFVIAQGVVTEKESRVVELLVSAVPIRTLLYGKVLGNGGLAFAQIVLLVLVGVAGAAATGEQDLLSLLARNAGWFVLFFALGFAVLSCLWAAAGAFASRNEDLQSTTTPLQLLVIVPFFASSYVQEGTLRTVLSYLPFSSPMVMPARLLEGEAAAWEAGLSSLVLLGTAWLAVRIGERLYRASLLRTRGKTSLTDAWSGRVPAGV